jgi:hypothetical protein
MEEIRNNITEEDKAALEKLKEFMEKQDELLSMAEETEEEKEAKGKRLLQEMNEQYKKLTG